jgi:hypothetical protein
MAGLLIGVGALALLAGAVMIGFGIPVNEFSFGNTLISGDGSVAADRRILGRPDADPVQPAVRQV